MTVAFTPANKLSERHGLFIALVGGTNSGKTFSALRLARGIAGPTGRIAVLDTEGGRTVHLKDQFDFDVSLLSPPFLPEKFSDAAYDAEKAGYDVLLIDSFSMEWVGQGGILDWQEHELERMAGDDFKKRERVKMASWIKPKRAHKKMVNSFLQRTMPVIFAIRGEETIKPGDAGEKPVTIFKAQMDKRFGFETTVSFRLAQEAQGIIDLSDPKSHKLEGPHKAIFRDGEQLSEAHGERIAAWAAGKTVPASTIPGMSGNGGEKSPLSLTAVPSSFDSEDDLLTFARKQGEHGEATFMTWFRTLLPDQQATVKTIANDIKARW